MEDDFEFNLPMSLLPGIDLSLWFNIVVGVLVTAVLVTAIVLLVT